MNTENPYFAVSTDENAIECGISYGSALEGLSGRVLDLRSRGCGLEPHRRCVVSLSKTLILCLVLAQPRKTCPDMTEKMLTGT